MRSFAALFTELDTTTSTNAKVEALQRYFAQAPARDAAWAVYFLSGGKPRQVVSMASLALLACEVAGIEPWLFDECYQAVGDMAETIAHVLPRDAEPSDVGLAQWVEDRLLPLRGLPEEEIASRVRSYWRELDPQGRFLMTKLVGGGFRVSRFARRDHFAGTVEHRVREQLAAGAAVLEREPRDARQVRGTQGHHDGADERRDTQDLLEADRHARDLTGPASARPRRPASSG